MDEAEDSTDDKIEVDRAPSGPVEQASTFSGAAAFERGKLENSDLRADIKLKRTYFSVTRKITRQWVQFIVAVVLLQFVARIFGRGFEAAEFIAIVTTTTATLVGFWVIVGAYLFPRRKD